MHLNPNRAGSVSGCVTIIAVKTKSAVKMKSAATAIRARIRAANIADLPVLKDIINAEILSSTASWTTRPRSQEDMHAWYDARLKAGYPVLVAECPATGDVAGYASFGSFRSGEGYAATVEHSVYVHQDFRGRGIAPCLIDALIERAKTAGMRLMIGGVSGDAEASLRLHRKMGFREVGRIPGAGMKFGRSLDLVLMAISLVPGAGIGQGRLH